MYKDLMKYLMDKKQRDSDREKIKNGAPTHHWPVFPGQQQLLVGISTVLTQRQAAEHQHITLYTIVCTTKHIT